MPDSRKHQVESINFEYSLDDFAEDWEGVRRYVEQKHTGPNRTVRLVVGARGQERTFSSIEDDSLSDINQWFLDRYGDDPDYLYARFMRFTILANVFQDYEQEIRAAGLARRDGYSEDLLKRLLKLRVHPDEHNFAKLDRQLVVAAIRETEKIFRFGPLPQTHEALSEARTFRATRCEERATAVQKSFASGYVWIRFVTLSCARLAGRNPTMPTPYRPLL